MDFPSSWQAVAEPYRRPIEAQLRSDEAPIAWFEPNLDHRLHYAGGFVVLTARRILATKPAGTVNDSTGNVATEIDSWPLDACAAIDAAGHFLPDPHAGNFIVTAGGLRMYDVLYSMSAEQWSTVKKDAARARTARTIRGLIDQLLDKLPFSDDVQVAGREFTTRTRGVDPTLADIRAAFGDVMEKLRNAGHF